MMTDLISKRQMVEKIDDLFLDKYEAKASSDLTEFYKEVLKILINEKGQSVWTSVKDRLPEGCETVLICNANKKFVTSGYYSPVEKRWNQIGNRFLLFTITHWMSLPEPPESEDDAE